MKNKYKQQTVDAIFTSVSKKYDLMNDLMSLGMHRLWKKKFIETIDPKNNTNLLDLASGSGDIAIDFLSKTKCTKATITDINQSMLDIAKTKLINKCLISRIKLICCAAELIEEKNKYEYCTISFGLRNTSNTQTTIAKAFEALKSGGQFCCMEFSKVNNKLINKLYKFYSFNVIPKIGKLVTNNEFAYHYLADTIDKFCHAEELSQEIQDAGFQKVQCIKLTQGIVAIHLGIKP